MAVFFEKSRIFSQTGLDLIIKKELGENSKLFSQKLITEINCSIHYSSSVSPDWIGNISNVDRIQMFVLTATLHKNLMIQIVQIIGNKHMNISHNFQNVQALF